MGDLRGRGQGGRFDGIERVIGNLKQSYNKSKGSNVRKKDVEELLEKKNIEGRYSPNMKQNGMP